MLIDQVQSDLKQAQLDRDETRVSTLRMLLSEIHNLQIQKGSDQFSDREMVTVIQKEAKKRKEAAAGFRQGGREETALKEEAELKILEQYLPQQLSDEQLSAVVEQVILESGVSSIQDMGKIIGVVMGKVGAGADGSRVSALVKEKLS